MPNVNRSKQLSNKFAVESHSMGTADLLQGSGPNNQVVPEGVCEGNQMVTSMMRSTNGADIPAVGAAIKKMRRRLGLTQEQLALRTGLKRAYIGDIELKDRNVSLKTLAVIADALDMKVSELVAMAEDRFDNNPQDETLAQGAD